MQVNAMNFPGKFIGQYLGFWFGFICLWPDIDLHLRETDITNLILQPTLTNTLLLAQIFCCFINKQGW